MPSRQNWHDKCLNPIKAEVPLHLNYCAAVIRSAQTHNIVYLPHHIIARINV